MLGFFVPFSSLWECDRLKRWINQTFFLWLVCFCENKPPGQVVFDYSVVMWWAAGLRGSIVIDWKQCVDNERGEKSTSRDLSSRHFCQLKLSFETGDVQRYQSQEIKGAAVTALSFSRR
ncbi:hypothetical protein CHARACLAT_005706 [Characodon lateralis]|uniref:Uncharacterized protein n=1 Tax=Characodon lateralis TaxID=208331 RepID=A0ABU7E7C4_9TELE|nr:hypothetical protein [Characodon lateralis]